MQSGSDSGMLDSAPHILQALTQHDLTRDHVLITEIA